MVEGYFYFSLFVTLPIALVFSCKLTKDMINHLNTDVNEYISIWLIRIMLAASITFFIFIVGLAIASMLVFSPITLFSVILLVISYVYAINSDKALGFFQSLENLIQSIPSLKLEIKNKDE